MKEHLKGKIGEDAVNAIADLTFFSNFCYPGPKDENKDKKEICDLLIIFRDVVFIISVKNYEFKGLYQRYFNNTLKKAVDQIQGAERKLFASNREIEFEHPQNGSLVFDPKEYNHVYRLIVNHSNSPNFYPGTAYTKQGKLVHIFNWDAFYKTLVELDTVSDLVSYIVARSNQFSGKQVLILNGKKENWDLETEKQLGEYMERTIQSQSIADIISGTELDLLSTYLSNQRSFPFETENQNNTIYNYDLEGEWNNYISRIEVERKKEADGISYLIDEFIKRDILYYDDEQRRKIATEILSLTRHDRRILGMQFDGFLKKYQDCNDYYMARRFGVFGNLTIGFFMHGNGISLEQSMKYMSIALLGYSHYEGYKSKKVILIGVNARISQWKFAFNPSVERLNDQDEKDLVYNLKILKWFTHLEKFDVKSDEYPEE